MKVFLDANILVSVLNKEYPLFPFTSRILSLSDNQAFRIFTSPLCLAIGFYFAAKKHNEERAKHKLAVLSRHISISPNLEDGVIKTFENPKINDVEDGFEYYAAVCSGCDCIVTENKGDFYFSELEVLSSMEFFEKYVAKRS
ncbi:MAG: PIN domain-containing protein [Mucilaginibacter polytrichastri]|nr:PIN domain-containing protein [Mucilaginibacter polytrichastri]